MKKSLYLKILTAAICTINIHVSAQHEKTHVDTIDLNPVVVVGSRYTSSLYETPDPVTVVNREAIIDNPPMHLPDLLMNTHGVFMQQTNHGGGSPFVRGLTGYHTLIMIDGIRLNNAIFRSGPNQYLNTIDPLMIQQIEIMRGPGSVEYGTDAIGGTLYIKTLEPAFADSGAAVNGSIYGKYLGYNMEISGRGQVEISTKKTGITAGISRKKYGNIRSGGDLGELPFTNYDEYSADIKTKFKLTEKQTVLAGWQYHKQNDIQLYHKLITGDYTTYSFDPQLRNLLFARHTVDIHGTFLQKIQSTISLHQSEEIRKKARPGDPFTIEEQDNVSTTGVNVELFSTIGNHIQGVSGIDLYFDEITSQSVYRSAQAGADSLARGLYPPSSNMSSLAAFSRHTIGLGKFQLTGGLRYNYFILSLQDNRFGDLAISPSALVGSLSASYRIYKNTDLIFRVNNAFRAPNINDVSSFGIADFRYEVPNFKLGPEKSFNKEFGLKAGAEKLYGSFNIYHNRLTDLMVNVKSTYEGNDSIDGVKVYTRDNIAEALLLGIEGELKYKANEIWIFSAFINYTYGQNITSEEPLRRVPPLNGLISASYAITNNLAIIGEYRFAGMQDRLSSGDIDDSRIPEGGTPAWNVINLRASFRLKQIQLNGGVINLSNEVYKTHGSGIYMPGRNIYINLTFNF